MKILDFVRHGLSQDLVHDIRSRPDTPLVDRGREQVRSTGIAMRRQGVRYDVILSSPLPRALETAEIIASQVSYDADNILTDPELVERDWGEYSGKSNEWIYAQIGREPSAFDALPGVETLEELQARAARVFNRTKTRNEGRILIVGHGQFARALRCHVKGQRPTTTNFHGARGFRTGELLRVYPDQHQDT